MIFKKCILAAFAVLTCSGAVAQEISDKDRATSLVCNSMKVAGVDNFVIEGALRKNLGFHAKYWSITNSKGKVWALVDLTPNQKEAIASFENRKVSARVRCTGENGVDEVQIAEITFQ